MNNNNNDNNNNNNNNNNNGTITIYLDTIRTLQWFFIL